MSSTPKTVRQMVEEITQTKRDQEAEWKLLATANQQLQGLTLWTIPDLVEALTYGRVHIAPGHDPALTAPTSTQEALDLAWSLAHEVKEGQEIPSGTRLLLRDEHGLLREDETTEDWRCISTPVDDIRTLDPLPDPEPDWLNAPAVVAFVKGRVGDPQVFSRENKTGTQWLRDTKVYHWDELTGVTPLYPKEEPGAPS